MHQKVGEIVIKKIQERINEIYDEQEKKQIRLKREEQKWRKHQTLYMISQLIDEKQITPELGNSILKEKWGLTPYPLMQSEFHPGHIESQCLEIIKYFSMDVLEKYSFFPIDILGGLDEPKILKIAIACPEHLPEFKKTGTRIKLKDEENPDSLVSTICRLKTYCPFGPHIEWLLPLVTTATSIRFCISKHFPRRSSYKL